MEFAAAVLTPGCATDCDDDPGVQVPPPPPANSMLVPPMTSIGIVSRQSTSANTTQYAVTVISTAGGWAVNDIELAKPGNF